MIAQGDAVCRDACIVPTPETSIAIIIVQILQLDEVEGGLLEDAAQVHPRPQLPDLMGFVPDCSQESAQAALMPYINTVECQLVTSWFNVADKMRTSAAHPSRK